MTTDEILDDIEQRFDAYIANRPTVHDRETTQPVVAAYLRLRALVKGGTLTDEQRACARVLAGKAAVVFGIGEKLT